MSEINGFTEETEIMTVDGFKYYNELKVGEDVYAWKAGELITTKLLNISKVNYAGETHVYRGRDMFQQFTPTHLVLHQKNNSKVLKITPSSTLIDRKTPLTMPVVFQKCKFKDYPISDELLELLTIIICDGTIKSNTMIRIFKSPKRYGIERITELLDHLGVSYTTKDKETSFDTALTEEELGRYKGNTYLIKEFSLTNCHNLVNMLNGTKKELPEFMTRLSKRQSELVINTWAKFDGNVDKTCYGKTKMQVDNDNIAEQLSHICIRACKRPHITERLVGNNKTVTKHVTLHLRAGKDAKIKEIQNYEGIIWNVNIEEDIALFRNKGYVFLSVV